MTGEGAGRRKCSGFLLLPTPLSQHDFEHIPCLQRIKKFNFFFFLATGFFFCPAAFLLVKKNDKIVGMFSYRMYDLRVKM